MDLAEIRKKAQKEQKGKNEIADLSPAVPEELIQGGEEGSQVRGETPSEIIGEPYQVGPAPATGKVPDTAPAAFDPLSVLVAGREAARADLDTLEDSIAAAAAAGEELQEFLSFRVSSEIYAINIMAIKEIIKPREVTEIPRAPGFVSGVLSLRGIIIPIFNMRMRLGLPGGEKSGKERIIVVKKGDEYAGIVVDEVTQVVKIASATIEKPPAVLDGIDRDFVSGIGRFGNQMLILLNQEKILDISIG